MLNANKKKNKVFIDVFAGCGGLSLGLINAGWKGLFAVEKDPMAFETLKYNLIDGKKKGFDWPSWLEKESMPISRLFRKHKDRLSKFRGKVDLIAGGPPCQGFSMVGLRDKNDPRNKLTGEYLKLVKIISPNFLLLENVRGFGSAFVDDKGVKEKESYAEYVESRLVKLGYRVDTKYIKSSDFGVPQLRTRFIMVAVKERFAEKKILHQKSPLDFLYDIRTEFLRKKRLDPKKIVTVREAISDLKVTDKALVPCTDSSVSGFSQIYYKLPDNISNYQKLMRKGLVNGSIPTDLRLVNHKLPTILKFKKIQKVCKKGRSLSNEDKEKLGINKQVITPLAPDKAAATVTTLPDDILHYSEPRILTVRENARLQSFPDWFCFQGNYTTGGKKRKKECPRYTQVGNAVPPLLGEALGRLLVKLDNS